MTGSRNHLRILLLVLAVAVLTRAGILWVRSDGLQDDRDAYLQIARNLAAGEGYTLHDSPPAPTAYRPPLYPLLLAGVFRMGGNHLAIGWLHLALGAATVWLTAAWGRRLGLGRGAYLAAGLVAFDPLLLQYTTLPMTEVTCAFLVTLLLTLAAGGLRRNSLDDAACSKQEIPTPNPDWKPNWKAENSHWRQIAVGVIFGLCVLCRPTLWAFGGLTALWWLGRHLLSPRPGHRASISRNFPALMILAALVTVTPWVVRNAIMMGRPVLTTTHGGYTLLLGNNPIFYEQVVRPPWGTVWDGASQRAWSQSLETRMHQAGICGEIARDGWMYRQAWQNIREDPGQFLQACGLRFARFWNVAPLGPAADRVGAIGKWGIGLFYGLIAVGLLIGIFRLRKQELVYWMPILLLLVSFTAVHLLYWSNTRMRAPLIPASALLAARALGGTKGKQVFAQPDISMAE